MNPFIRISLIVGLVIGLSSIASAVDPIRVFYDVGRTTYAVSSFKNKLPVLDTSVESNIDRARFDGEWSYSGELPVDPEFMSMVYPYRVRKNPEVYSNRGQPASYYIHLLSGFSDALSWDLEERRDHLIVLGWLVGDALQGVIVTESKVSRYFQGYLMMEGARIAPDGVLVAWLVDSAGRLVPVDNRKDDLNTELRIAAMNGDLETLARESDGSSRKLKRKDKTDRTLLMYAALGGRMETAAYLIDQGAKAFEADEMLASVLEIAAESGWLDIVKAIAKKQAKGSDQKVQYSIAAVNAYAARHQEIAIHLMKYGAKVNLNEESAPEKITEFYSSECVELARWAQSEYGVNGSYSKNGFNFMHAVAGYADTKLLESLESGGASLTEATEKGITPLLIASGLGNREAICWLMENGGRADGTGEVDPVLYAIREGIHESVSCLIDYGVNVNREEYEGLTPLMFACSLGEKEIAETLMNAGGLWLFESEYCDSVLARLARLDSPKLVEGLLKQGLALDYKLGGSLRLIDIAKFYGANEVVELLRKRSPGIELNLINGASLPTRPEVVQRTNIDYPFELQEKYGDVDVMVNIGIADGGAVGAVDVDGEVPKEIRDLVEGAFVNWSFKPLASGNDALLAVITIKVPLRKSLREKDIFDLDDVDELPSYNDGIDLLYPYELKQAGIGGFVLSEWILDDQGLIRRLKLLESSRQSFEAPTIEAIKQWKWNPAKKDGVPVAVRMRYRVDF